MGARCLIIGLDGAEWSIVRKMCEQGKLPNLGKLIKEGATAPLNSTNPPMTLPSWSSMLTGCNPGAHGIFDFVFRNSDTDDWTLEFSNATHRGVPTIHEWLTLQGKKVGSIAVPTTWPPYPVNGVMVSGFDSPVSTGIDGSFCYPSELYEDIQRRFGGLNFADFQESTIDDAWLEKARSLLLKEVERKQAIGEWLLESDSWDCFMLLFGESDTASHHFWRFYDDSSPRHEPSSVEIREVIPDVYQRLDEAVGALIQKAKPEVVCICSDHGFGGAGSHALFLNRYLESCGWLNYQQNEVTVGERGVDWMRRVALSKIPPKLQGKLFRTLPSVLKNRLETQTRFGAIDFTKTMALSDEMNYAATIRLNTQRLSKERENEIVEAIIKDLLAWVVDGQSPVKKVYKREEIYEGEYIQRSPELVLELNLRDGYTYTLLPSIRAEKEQTWRVFSPDEWQGGKGLGMNGSHRQFGVLILHGQGFKSTECEASMEDIAPTLLAALSEPIPSYMEGRVLREAFAEQLDVSYQEYIPSRPTVAKSTSGDEHSAIKDRLQQLGYL